LAALILAVRAAQADNPYLDDPHNRAEAAPHVYRFSFPSFF